MKKLLLFTIVILAFLVEGSMTVIPLTFSALLVVFILERSVRVILLALVLGLLLDSMSFRILGMTSLFFLVYFFLVLLYQRKFEIETLPYVFFATLVGSALFLWTFHMPFFLLGILISTIFACIIFQLGHNHVVQKVRYSV